MGMVLDIDGLTFEFPDGWHADKYDDWKFYRKQIGSHLQGLKAVDVLALSHSLEAYLIEVKDYSRPQTVKPSELPEAVAWKVIHTLAALLPASLNANDADEKSSGKGLSKLQQAPRDSSRRQPEEPAECDRSGRPKAEAEGAAQSGRRSGQGL